MKKLLILILIFFGISLNAQEVSWLCEGTTSVLTATCTGGTSPTVTWTDPSLNETTGATTTADEAGTYTWECEEDGCTATGTHVVYYEADPTSGITINAVDVCVGVDQTITATGVPAGYTYAWDFGTNGVPPTSTTASTVVNWTTAGSKTITLTITSDPSTYSPPSTASGCEDICDWEITLVITVGELTGSSTCN